MPARLTKIARKCTTPVANGLSHKRPVEEGNSESKSQLDCIMAMHDKAKKAGKTAQRVRKTVSHPTGYMHMYKADIKWHVGVNKKG